MWLASGCALIDGISGGGGDGTCESAFETDCTGSSCSDVVDIGFAPTNQSLGTCDAMSFAFDLDPVCGSVPDPDARTAVFRFQVAVDGDFQVCANSDDGFAGAKILLADTCDNTPFLPVCLNTAPNGCVDQFLSSGEHFLFFQEPNEGTCPPIELSISDDGGGGPELFCFNGIDDENDGLQDCEDPDCRTDPNCNISVFGDSCNGIDDFTDNMLFIGSPTDEGGCACLNDAGCDNLPGVGGPPYFCHQDPTDTSIPGFCAPSCSPVTGIDWCMQTIGIPCDANGKCNLSGGV